MRLDRFLWYARLAGSRSMAQGIARKGTLRLDGRRIDRAHAPVRVGSVLAFPWNGRVRIVRIEALPKRRGPPAEAASLYTNLESLVANPVDESEAAA
ncbi:RNA-binding S4 domain-containing protein [Sphingosinithalassobacter tenebrarum]|uniref:RNA-binding S4 domain-containing protein n=2 Tax=Stakelama tenebrarum TaxID=2711215 RepID=A0A6G6YAV8_9SPHN|nr:RNA-binding S4 domain-containing protein [Sphingosinithalassobacter tenebrarum]